MLASITPLGERGRHSRWGVTVTAFVVGATAAGAATGAVVGAIGAVALRGVGTPARLQTFAGVALLALAIDLFPGRAPGPRRQVDERWLDRYRGWVYGVGYGAQLGVGVATIVSSAASYVALSASLLVASAGSGALVMGCYGLVRGLAILPSAAIRAPGQLFALHRLLERGRRVASAAAALVLAGIVAGALL